MQDFFVTFGVQYGHGKNQELHPVYDWIDSAGYVRVTAPDDNTARQYINDILAYQWAFMYVDKPEVMFAPLGELAHWSFSR